MCILCGATQNFDPVRHAAGAVAFAELTETTDAANGSTTRYTMSLGDRFSGTLSAPGDRDWVAVTLEAGTSYDIALTGTSTVDTYLRLYDFRGQLINENDDGGAGTNSQLSYTPSSSGTYYLSAGAYDDQGSGGYTLELSTYAPPAVASLDELADFLVSGYWQWSDGDGQRAFDTSRSTAITVDLSTLPAEAQQLARWALAAWEMVADLSFAEVSSGAQISFQDNDSGAFALSNFSGEQITSSTVNVEASWLTSYGTTLDSYSFSTYVHEIGHALGLGHQGRYNGAARYGTDETFSNDSWQVSIMSYFSQTDNTSITASEAGVITPMMADIIAIQRLYGAPGSSSATAGNTTYGANSTLNGYMGDFFALLSSGTSNESLYGGAAVALTLYDQSGEDTIDLSFSTSADRLDLTAESYSDLLGLTGNLGIARGTVIEHAVLGSGNDTVTGNAADNWLRGQGGNDSLLGGQGDDTLLGGTGNDTLSAGAGDDLLNGEYGVASFDPGAGQVFRLYQATLNRSPDEAGHLSWTGQVNDGASLTDVVPGFINSAEFQNTYGATSNSQFVTLLYNNVLDRDPDSGGLANWTGALDSGSQSRAQVVLGFSESAEFTTSSADGLTGFMRSLGVDDRLIAGSDNNSLFGGWLADSFVFNGNDSGSHQVIGLEAWDRIELQNSGYADGATALAALRQSGANVDLQAGSTSITFLDSQIADFSSDMFLFA